jgi:hypothetical protein
MPKKKNLKLDQLKVKSFVTVLGKESRAIEGGLAALPQTLGCPVESLTDCPTCLAESQTDCRMCITGPTGCTDCTICYPCDPTMVETCGVTFCIC